MYIYNKKNVKRKFPLNFQKQRKMCDAEMRNDNSNYNNNGNSSKGGRQFTSITR